MIRIWFFRHGWYIMDTIWSLCLNSQPPINSNNGKLGLCVDFDYNGWLVICLGGRNENAGLLLQLFKRVYK